MALARICRIRRPTSTPKSSRGRKSWRVKEALWLRAQNDLRSERNQDDERVSRYRLLKRRQQWAYRSEEVLHRKRDATRPMKDPKWCFELSTAYYPRPPLGRCLVATNQCRRARSPNGCTGTPS